MSTATPGLTPGSTAGPAVTTQPPPTSRSGRAGPTPSARPTTGRASTSPCSPRSPSGSSCACRRRRAPRPQRRPARGRRASSGTATCPASSPASATATACTARTTPTQGQRCNPAKLLLDPYAKAIDGQIDGDESLFSYRLRATPRRATTDDSRGHTMLSVVVNPFFDWGNDRPPRHAYHETVIYEAHVKGLTMTPPRRPRGDPRHLRRPRRTRR